MNASVNKYVAVVDDDESVCQSLARRVRSAGYAARTFASGRDFLVAASRPGPCCLIVDVKPDLDGYHLARLSLLVEENVEFRPSVALEPLILQHLAS